MTHKTTNAETVTDTKETGKTGARILPPDNLVRKARLVIIDHREDMLGSISAALGGICEIPPGLTLINSLAGAMRSILKESPDMVMIARNFDPEDPNGNMKLLVAVKDNNPRAKVILLSEDEDDASGFDAVVQEGATETLVSLVKRFASGEDEGIVQHIDDAITGRVVPKIGSDEWEAICPTNVERKARLLVIDNASNVVNAVSTYLSGICIVSEGTPAAKSFEEAKRLVDEQKPDIVMVYDNFDRSDRMATTTICEYVKTLKPGASVILVVPEDGTNEINDGAPFDRIIHRNEVALIKETVKELASRY